MSTEGVTGNETDEGNEANLKALRAKAEKADKLAGEVQQLQRQIALSKSKVDTSHPAYELFEKSYDGDMTAEALDKAAEKYGLLKQAEQEEQTAQGMEFSDEQVEWLKRAGLQLPGAAPQHAAAASGQSRVDMATTQGQHPQAGQLSDTDWMQAKSPEELMARYQQAGGVTRSDL